MSSHGHGAGGCVPAQGDLTLRESVMRDRLVDGAAFGEALHAGRGRADRYGRAFDHRKTLRPWSLAPTR